MHKDLKDAIANDNLVLFVGAGMSMPLGFPSWTKLIIDILKELEKGLGQTLDKFNFSYYKSLGSNLDVFEVLDELERCNHKQRVKKLLYKKLKAIDFSSKSLERHKKLWKISSKIITTNYDKVLEKVKPEFIEHFSNQNQFQQIRSIQGEPFLYKIHGDISNPDTCILFTSDYIELYKSKKDNKDTLRQFFSGKTILFLGFSLDDPFIKKQLEYIHNLYNGYSNNHFLISKSDKNLRELNIETILIENWNEAFDEKLDELIALKQASKPTDLVAANNEDSIDISKETDLIKLRNIFDLKKKELEDVGELSMQEAYRELSKIRDRIQELQAKELDFEQYIPEHKQEKLEYIFNEIFNAKKLSKELVQEINTVRDQYSGENEWYHRSVLVSAIACSIINSDKLDPKKIELLIDFTNDSEDKVWQKAITYLFLVLNHLGNKWVRFKGILAPKLRGLQEKTKIQEALNIIIAFMQMKLQGVTPVDGKIFENEYFKDTPFNYFLPFYADNPSIENIYEDDSIEDVEEYIKWLHNSPLSDAFKYLLCNTKNVNSKVNEDETEEEKLASKVVISLLLGVHHTFEPYLNYVNDFLNFYQNYPKSLKEIKQEVTIVKINKFKNLLLNTVEEHRAIARQFMLQEDWGKAITHYEALLKIKVNDKGALLNLVNCFDNVKKNDIDKLKIRLRIEDLYPKDYENLYEIVVIYNDSENYNKALEYIEKILQTEKDIAKYYYQRADIKHKLKRYKDAILDYDKAIEINEKEAIYYHYRADTKYNLGDYEGSLLDCDKAIELDDKESAYYNNRANTKQNLKDYEGSLLDYDKAIELDNKESAHYNNRGTVKERLKDFKGSLLDYDKAIKLDNNNADYYDSRGITKRILKDYSGSLLDHDKAIKLDNNNADYYNSRGITKRILKDYEGALSDYDKAIEIDDKNPDYYIKKANIYRDLKKFELAHKLCNQALDLGIEDGRDIGTKAAIYASEEKENLFYKYLEKAFRAKAKANWLDDDIKEKYKDEKRFQELLAKYNQSLDDEINL